MLYAPGSPGAISRNTLYKTDVPAARTGERTDPDASCLTRRDKPRSTCWRTEGVVGGQPTAGDRHGVWRLQPSKPGRHAIRFTDPDVLPRCSTWRRVVR